MLTGWWVRANELFHALAFNHLHVDAGRLLCNIVQCWYVYAYPLCAEERPCFLKVGYAHQHKRGYPYTDEPPSCEFFLKVWVAVRFRKSLFDDDRPPDIRASVYTLCTP